MAKKAISMGVVGCLIAALAASLSIAQPPGAGGQAGPGGQRGQRGMMRDPAQMRQMMEDRMKEQLGASDEEWKVLGPRVMKVSELSRQVSGAGRGMMMMFGGRGRNTQGGQRGQRGQGNRPGAADRVVTPVEKAQEELMTTLEDTSASAETIKTQLVKLRMAREKGKAELATAQQDLRKVLTVRQEAQLVLMGMLD